MHKSKKKEKSGKIPKPIKIKKEKNEEDRTLHPISHYIDDRLELVKQIFGTLKPKTITNLAPDFIKKKTLDEIEELCLNELLGISTKRLLSIINAAKCPTDTESSSDSDVHNIEEHISLEEISSDSEIEGNSTKRKKNKIRVSVGSSKKDGKNGDEKDKNDGQISVLELLELQARARAIRSQLALEPVTKIEVDSDEESDENSSNRSKDSRSSSRKIRKRKSGEQSTTTKSTKDISSAALNCSKKAKSNGTIEKSSISGKDSNQRSTLVSSKIIKLKRNFRSNRENSGHIENQIDCTPKSNVEALTEIKDELRSRSLSPDVIPIVSEPVTLMISDSSDEDDGSDTAKKTAVQDTAIDRLSEEENKEATKSHNNLQEITEPEDGEILEDPTIATTSEKAKDIKLIEIPINAEQTDHDAAVDDNEVSNKDAASAEVNGGTNNNQKCELKLNQNFEQNKTFDDDITEANIRDSKTEHKVPDPIDDEYDDQNDDVISIEGGDLESEMTEHLEEDSKSNPTTKEENKHKPDDPPIEDDIISLESSDDELSKKSSESWNSRWLKSSKVSKVLATSRLGKRVRDKIKKSKRTKKDSTREAAEAEANKASGSFTSKHEDGSIEQYKELLEMRQRKA